MTVDHQVIVLGEIIKKDKKNKEITEDKYIARSAT